MTIRIQPPRATSTPTIATTNGADPPKKMSSPERPMTMNGGTSPSKAQSMLVTTRSNAGRSVSFSGTSDDPTIGNKTTVKQRQCKYKEAHGANSAVNCSFGLSGGSPTDNDAAYCTEIARRSVARAALHLGIEGMEGEALDALGNILQGYMITVRCHNLVLCMRLWLC